MEENCSSGLFVTRGIKGQVVQAWLVQQLALGTVDKNEVLSIFVCKDDEERLRLLQVLADRVGDSAPIEILTGIVSENDYKQEDSYSR